MAISNLGTVNKLPAAEIPAGYVLPVIASFEDWQYKYVLTLNVLKATVETATPSTTLTAIFNNATIGLNKQIVDIIAADFLTTPAVTTFAELYGLDLSINKSNFLGNAVASYSCQVVIYVKAI
jgi:hypothetical protein